MIHKNYPSYIDMESYDEDMDFEEDNFDTYDEVCDE